MWLRPTFPAGCEKYAAEVDEGAGGDCNPALVRECATITGEAVTPSSKVVEGGGEDRLLIYLNVNDKYFFCFYAIAIKNNSIDRFKMQSQ